jgi:formiminotetrahydrofolate cyclodeaminase
MENYKNVEGASGGSAGADIGGALGGALISGVVGGLFAKGEAKKARELQEQLAKLSLAQQKELEQRLQDVRAETERQSLVYQFLAVQNNNEMLNRIQSKRYTSYIVLGVGVTTLAVVILKLSKK